MCSTRKSCQETYAVTILEEHFINVSILSPSQEKLISARNLNFSGEVKK
jgi:hypothetical protein